MTTAPRHVLLLGGTGFLGTRLHSAFDAAGYRVTTASRTGGPVRLDLTATAPGELAALLDDLRPDLVVNAAGRAWQATEQDMLEANALAVEDLVEALAAAPGRPRLVHLGTIHEYGPGTVGSGTPEEHEPAPVTAYGKSKLRGSLAVLRAVEAGRLDAVVLRVANVCGPGTARGSLLGSVGARLADAVRAGTPELELRLAPLRARRDYVDVRDVCDAVLAAASVPLGPKDATINVGRGTAVPVRDLVDRLAACSGLDVRIVEERAGDTGRTDVEWQQSDISRARRVLGWSPRRSLDESLGDLLSAELSTRAG
ncbi:NAD(P)-dependent oxidoreductase [Streptomyces sp. NPDC006512]|uniref:NAD-dependent epimerase/dehydratase family protein n=1 Tax=Streptomyces sp. NPDC006512 TaxID=3154307 RepID=UPI0033A9FC9F